MLRNDVSQLMFNLKLFNKYVKQYGYVTEWMAMWMWMLMVGCMH